MDDYFKSAGCRADVRGVCDAGRCTWPSSPEKAVKPEAKAVLDKVRETCDPLQNRRAKHPVYRVLRCGAAVSRIV